MLTSTGKSTRASEEFLELSRVWLKDEYLPQLTGVISGLSEDDVWWRPNEASNSIGNLVLHLCGNVRLWISSTLGGVEFRRNRDAEFSERGPIPKAELLERITSVIQEADQVLAGVREDSLLDMHEIQKFKVTTMADIYHVVEHFNGHLGQILYVYKMRTGKPLGSG